MCEGRRWNGSRAGKEELVIYEQGNRQDDLFCVGEACSGNRELIMLRLYQNTTINGNFSSKWEYAYFKPHLT